MSGLQARTEDVNRALRDRFCAPEWALFFEVANGTGAGRVRYCDAMAMSLFPSRGLRMHGFEVKISRGDWQRELKNPHKVEEGNYRYCDHWWIVAPPGIVKDGELPETWGLLEYQHALKEGERSALRQKKAAPRLKATAMDRMFIAAFLRRADEANSRIIGNAVRSRTADLRQKLEDVQNDNRSLIEAAVEERTQIHKKLVERVRQFEAESGISIIDFGFTPQHGRLIRAMKAAGFTEAYGGLSRLASELATTADRVREHLAEFDKLAPPKAEAAE